MRKRAMQRILFTLFIIFLASACRRESMQPELLKATVFNTSDQSCGLPVLDFTEDSVRIRTIMGSQSLKYVTKNLPAALNVQNKKVLVDVTKYLPSEDFACTAVGISYPHVKLTAATERE